MYYLHYFPDVTGYLILNISCTNLPFWSILRVTDQIISDFAVLTLAKLHGQDKSVSSNIIIINEKISRFCQTVFEISKHLLLPTSFRPNFSLSFQEDICSL